MRFHRSRSVGLAAGLVLALATDAGADSGGVAGAAITYRTREVGSPVTVTVEIEPVPFAVNRVGGKYRLVRLLVRNETDTRIDLDGRADTITASNRRRSKDDPTAKGEPVPGILTLAAVDAATWDAFGDGDRMALAYPRSLEKKSAASVYVFFPADQLKDVPWTFDWTIQSLGKTIAAERPRPTAK